MKRTANPQLDRLIIDHLATLYKLRQKREGIHLSTLVYCLTRSFFQVKDDLEPTDREIMLFAIGLGLQDILTPKQAVVPVFEKGGVIFSPDFMFPIGNIYCELKTTRASLKKNLVSLPEVWVEYIMGGCFLRETNTYELSGLYILGSYAPPFPEIYSETLVFDDDEIYENWERLMERKVVYEKALETNQPPTPFKYCKKWECDHCRYSLQCNALDLMYQKEIDKE